MISLIVSCLIYFSKSKEKIEPIEQHVLDTNEGKQLSKAAKDV